VLVAERPAEDFQLGHRGVGTSEHGAAVSHSAVTALADAGTSSSDLGRVGAISISSLDTRAASLAVRTVRTAGFAADAPLRGVVIVALIIIIIMGVCAKLSTLGACAPGASSKRKCSNHAVDSR